VASSPVVADGKVYVGSFDNKTYALNADTGALIWNVTTGYDQCVQASPAFANGVIYTGGAFDHKVYALDATTGATKWSYTADAGITSAPAIVGNTVYVSSTLANKTYALNSQNGNLVWSYQTGDNIYSSPAVVNGVAYFGSYDGNLYAIGQSSSQVPEIPSSFTNYIIAVIAVALIIVAVAVTMLRKRNK
jgi:outer membrane protein assembly factor BamB